MFYYFSRTCFRLAVCFALDTRAKPISIPPRHSLVFHQTWTMSVSNQLKLCFSLIFSLSNDPSCENVLTQRRAASSENQLPPGNASNEPNVNAAAMYTKGAHSRIHSVQTPNRSLASCSTCFPRLFVAGGVFEVSSSWLDPKPIDRNVILRFHVPFCPLIYSQP